MKLKVALFQGASNNAGDYLIVDRTKKLLKHFYPECEISEYYRNESLEPYVEDINKNDIGIFAGGPAYFDGFYPTLAPIVSNLRTIKIPLMFVGAGWFGDSSNPMILYSDKFGYQQKKLLTRVVKDSRILGCRDVFSTHVLRNNGYDSALMTGCPAWYDLDKLDEIIYSGTPLKKAKKICISDCGNREYLGQVAQILILARDYFGYEPDIYFVNHKTMDGSFEEIMRKELPDLNIKFVDISGKLDGFSVYDDCDVHIGFRVHAHIYNLSKRKISILIEEDSRGAGVNDALGLSHICVTTLTVKNDNLVRIVNKNLYNQVKDSLLDMENYDCSQMSFAYQKMRYYFENMKNHLLSIKDIVSSE